MALTESDGSSTDGALLATRLVTSFNLMAMTIFAYDYLLTIGMEVELVWPSKWSVMKVLYLLQRYMPFIDTMIIQPQMGRSYATCARINSTTSWMFIVGIALSESILTLRTWAVWRRDIRLTIGLPIFFIICWVPNFAFMGIFLNSVEFGDSPDPSYKGCFITGGNPIIAFCWIILIIYEAGILILMAIQGFASFRQGGDSALYNAVYRDGFIYYIYVFALSTINVVIILTLPVRATIRKTMTC